MTNQVQNIIRYLEQSGNQYQEIQNKGLGQKLIELRKWQCRRLMASHKEMYSDRRFRPAIDFFVAELYGPKDFTQRDQDIARVVPKMEKWLPSEALESLEVAIHLNAMSQELDIKMVEMLGDQRIDNQSYAQAYRDSDNKIAREMQIDFIEQLGNDLKEVVDITGISLILKMARTPAKLAGLETLQQFLEDGFNAFKNIGEIEDFIVPVVQKERDIMNGVIAGLDVLPEETATA